MFSNGCHTCILLLFSTVRVQHPTALKLVRTIEAKQLQLPDDKVNVIIEGMCAQSEHVLLLCDAWNGRVKAVSTSTDAVTVTVCFHEADSDWRVLGCVLVDAADGQFMAAAEVTHHWKHHRFVFAGPRDAAGSFCCMHSIYVLHASMNDR